MLKREALDALAAPLGLESIADKARFVDMDQAVFHRIYKGKRGAGGPNIQRIINAPWPEPVTIDDLFEVVAA
jgi:hypothetical protein